MSLDKKSLERLLRLNDDQLRVVLGRLLKEYGVDSARIPLEQMDMSALRTTLGGLLSVVKEEDINGFLGLLGGGRERDRGAGREQSRERGGYGPGSGRG